MRIIAGKYRGRRLKSPPSLQTRPTSDRLRETLFNIIFFDPPYASNYGTVLNYAGDHAPRLLSKEGIVVIEHFSKNDLQEEFRALKRYRRIKQGESSLSFYTLATNLSV